MPDKLAVQRPISLAILAMGGEGGGVLSDWLVNAAEHANYLVQTTSVPGVAQRTGATIYYLEFFPRAAANTSGQKPVFSLMPVPGNTDIVVASELMEAGRAVQRGFVTPDRTTLIASTHRVYSMTEKMAMTDGRVDSSKLIQGCKLAARQFIGFDMFAVSEKHRSAISAVLLGTIAGSQALPFSRADFEHAIRANGVAVEANLSAFANGYTDAQREGAAPSAETLPPTPAVADRWSHLIARFTNTATQRVLRNAIAQLIDYQDDAYADFFWQLLTPFIFLADDTSADAQSLLNELVRQLALAMTYDDAIRVAELKIRSSRFERVRAEVRLQPHQLLTIAEFVHPRIEEIADIFPERIGTALLQSAAAWSIIRPMTAKGRIITTTSVRGFLQLYAIASLKPLRRRTLRYQRELRFIESWLTVLRGVAANDLPLSLRIAQLRGLVKGYGDTHARGLSNYNRILDAITASPANALKLDTIDRLIAAANADETGVALSATFASL